MLQAQGLAVSVGGRLVVEGADFTVMPKDKVGLVGRNGAGKTSLFRVLGGHAEPAAGRVIRKGGFGYLPQDPRMDAAADARTAVTHILSGRGVDADIERIEKLRIAMEEHPDERAVARYSRAEELFRANGGYAAESEARAIAAGLGLDGSRQDRPVGVLSGGERRRAEISRILFAGSDVLLLDEPTNHLDVDAKEWLLGFLRTYRGALLVISHDLELLDEAITRVLHLDRPGEAATGTLVEYRGTYSQYVHARAEDERRAAKVAARQGKEIARLQAVVDRFGAKATKAAMAHSIEKRIARIEEDRVEVRQGDRTLRVRFPAPPAAGRTVIEAVGLTKAYGGPDIFADVSFDLGRGERLLVLGLNGAGKTTLLRILAAETDGRPGHVPVRTQRDHRLLRPGARQPPRRRDAARQHPRRGASRRHAHRDRAARPARHVRAVRRQGVPGGRHVVGRGEDEAGAGDVDGRAQQPAAPRRADQQPRPEQP